jgi:hypothetical protein
MKYIAKNKLPTSLVAADKLHNWRDNYRDKDGKTFQDICSGLTSKKAWHLISEDNPEIDIEEGKIKLKKYLKEALGKEQGQICCYCGQKLTIETVIEHFLNKGDDICERTYNYKNLLVSCNGNQQAGNVRASYKTQGETMWEDAVQHINNTYGLSITVQELKYINIKVAEKDILEPKTALKIESSPQHCDVAKHNFDLPINPTELPDCLDRFDYTDDGDIHGKDADAQKAIQILNLKAAILKKDRADAWIGFKEALEGELSMIQKEYSLDKKKALELLFRLELESDNTYHFCVVKRSLLKERIKELSPLMPLKKK